ncbi:hypothetical protein Bca101_048970 [Brassica carinata]
MVLRLSGSSMLLPPPPEPPPVTFLLDLASMIAPPDLPVLSDHSGAPDLFSFILKIAEPPPVSGTTTSSSVCLLLVSLGVNFVMPWLPHTAVCRVQFYYILWRKSSFPPLLLGFVLKDTVFVTPLIESELVGLCCTSTKFVADFHAFYAAACSDSSSLCVFSDSHGFSSLSSTLGISILSCLCAMYASIQCVFVSRIAFDAAVYLTSMVASLYLNNSSMAGV